MPTHDSVLKKNPELVEEFADKAADLLHDKNQAVLVAGVTLMLAVCTTEPAVVEKYRWVRFGGVWGGGAAHLVWPSEQSGRGRARAREAE